MSGSPRPRPRPWLPAVLAAVLLLGTVQADSAAAQSCSPNPAGATNSCDAAGPASQDSGAGVDTGAGNPINVITGNKHQREVDLAPLPGELGLEIVRHYNSSASRVAGLLGNGWRLSYETDLYVLGRSIQILQADGARLIFSRDGGDSGACTSRNPALGRIIIRPTPRGEEFTWEWTNGRKLDFNAQGRLEQIRSPSGAFVTLTRGPGGELLKVTDPQHRVLRFRYPDRHSDQPRAGSKPGRFLGVVAIDTPVGTFRYERGVDIGQSAGNLVKVAIPTHYDSLTPLHAYTERGVTGSSVSRIYHYENRKYPRHLTGITVSGAGSDGILVNQRIATYRYDGTGKAVLSVRGEPAGVQAGSGIGQVSLRYPKAGVTLLTNSLGQTTTYRHAIVAGEYRLLEVRGAGCTRCTDTNVRYAYDKLGRLAATTRLDTEGRPIASIETERDADGRILRVRRVVFSNGGAGRARWLLRYEYSKTRGDGFSNGLPDERPTLIARPSVVPGKEHSLRIRYNAAGQALTVTESGWSPTTTKTNAQPIAREIAYRYASINGRSLLAQIDGPRAVIAGGSDTVIATATAGGLAVTETRQSGSDFTRFVWDARGSFVTAITTPGGFRSTVKYDDAGRIIELVNSEGRKTRFDYDARNQLTATVKDGISTRHRYDAFGNRVETGLGTGTAYQALAHFGFDVARRLLWRASHLGILETRRFDNEGKLLEASRRSASFAQTERYAYDAWGRLTLAVDAAGGQRRIAYDAQNRPEVFTDALGRERRYRYDANGNLAQLVEAANSVEARLMNTSIRFERDALDRIDAVIAPNGASTRIATDDFGRTVAVSSPDSGAVTRSFDAADRLVSSADAEGNRASYEYDAAGRINKQTVFAASLTRSGSAPPVVTAWRYEGSRLVAIDHPGQSEAYAYDKSGRLASRHVSLKLADGSELSTVTRYRYDEWRQLSSVSLPDGSTLEYRRNGQNQIVALERSRIRTPWLAWLLPAQPMATDIERDIVGLSGFRYGNGIEVRFQRSREGVLARVVYRRPQALIDRRYLWDEQGNLLRNQDRSAAASRTQNYAYDAQDRLIAAASSRTGAQAGYSRYFYDGAGNRLLSQEGIVDQADIRSNSVKAAYETRSNRWLGASQNAAAAVRYDAVGQPGAIGNREYVWDALGQLIEVRQESRRLASYRYNHRGERIAKTSHDGQTHYLYEAGRLSAELDGQGRITRQYVYLADQPVAVIDTPKGRPLSHDERSLPGQIAADIVTLFTAWFGGDETIAYLHTNHLGAPELATDAQGNPVWAATYAPFGRITRAVGRSDFKLKLRLPGQYEDEETGLYYNGHRYYDPDRGQYLTPDPLGLSAGINAYAYVANNPLKYVDPEGLILFAFDGTGNSYPAPSGDSISNVRKFYMAYDEIANGKAFYITGIGTTDENMPYKGNTANGDGFDQRVQLGFEFLDGFIDSDAGTNALDIDVVGFSRGAAEARVWLGQLAGKQENSAYTSMKGKSRCLNLRFEGLWDTVPHLGYFNGNESKYDFAVPAQVKYAAQAVALNEHRGGWFNFNALSILQQPATSSGGNRNEMGFIGSHADIGGGYGTGDLSDVALMWMIQQAKDQGIKIKAQIVQSNGWDTVSDPVIHDKSANRIEPQNTPAAEDRDFAYGNGATVKQAKADIGGKDTAWAQGNVTYYSQWCGSSGAPAVGVVDMQKYRLWLQGLGVNIALVSPVTAKPCQ